MYSIKFLEVIKTEQGMPILPMTITSPMKEVPEVFEDSKLYLSPFRGYKFQVSASEDGSWDIASSEVVGLANMMKLQQESVHKGGPQSLYSSNLESESMVKYLYKTLINNTLLQLGYRYQLSCKDIMIPENQEIISDYADMVYTYINTLINR